MENSNPCKEICKGVEVPSDDEVEALNAMKSIKLRVRELKKRISEISSVEKNREANSLSALEQELARLKGEWNQWEEKRRKAAKERMILLGHEEEGEISDGH